MKGKSIKLTDKENKTRRPGSHGGGTPAPGQIKKGPKNPQIRYVGDIPLL